MVAVGPGTASLSADSEGISDTQTLHVVEGLPLAFPLEGKLNVDFFYTAYVDHAPGGGAIDYHCGEKTYAGHQGTDLALLDFAHMDEGVFVQAAAAGTVTTVHDGAYDRNTEWGTRGFGNYVALDHGDGFETLYAHLKRDSIPVRVGDTVGVGDVLGEVGSSGWSDHPHLHFEVRQGDRFIDPFTGACGSAVALWRQPDSYQETFALLNSGLSRQDLTLDTVKQPPAQTDTVAVNQRMTLWVQLANIAPEMVSEWRMIGPDGKLAAEYAHSHTLVAGVSWWWAWFFPGEEGAWRMDFYHDGRLLASHSFEAVASQTVGAPPLAPGTKGAVIGMAGGVERELR